MAYIGHIGPTKPAAYEKTLVRLVVSLTSKTLVMLSTCPEARCQEPKGTNTKLPQRLSASPA